MVKANLKQKRLVGSPLQHPLGLDPSEVSLPPEARKLGERLLDIARNYILARRRRGEALLDAASWLNEARTVADEGRWYLFLDVTGTSPDVAERLLNIHLAASRDARFAEAVINGHLNQTVAGLLARPSTPLEVVDVLLESDAPPRVSDVQRAIRTRQFEGAMAETSAEGVDLNVENPHYAGEMPTANLRALNDLPAWVTPACEQIARARTTMLSVHGEVAKLDDYGAAMLAREIDHLLEAIGRITKTLKERRS